MNSTNAFNLSTQQKHSTLKDPCFSTMEFPKHQLQTAYKRQRSKPPSVLQAQLTSACKLEPVQAYLPAPCWKQLPSPQELHWVSEQLMGSLTIANTKQDHFVHISMVEPSQIASVFTITPTRAKPWSNEKKPTFTCSESQCYGNKHPPSPISISTVSEKSADPRYAHFMLRLFGYSDSTAQKENNPKSHWAS